MFVDVLCHFLILELFWFFFSLGIYKTFCLLGALLMWSMKLLNIRFVHNNLRSCSSDMMSG
jgi:hypothetical protein